MLLPRNENVFRNFFITDLYRFNICKDRSGPIKSVQNVRFSNSNFIFSDLRSHINKNINLPIFFLLFFFFALREYKFFLIDGSVQYKFNDKLKRTLRFSTFHLTLSSIVIHVTPILAHSALILPPVHMLADGS